MIEASSSVRLPSPVTCEHERVELVQDPATGLRAVIAIHSTALGPAVGGLRMRDYPDLGAAVLDALRLSEAMSLKNAAADLALGGGKAVIVDDGAPVGVRAERLLAFAAAVDALDGAYVTAEDVGTTPADMDLLATRTPHVLGRSLEQGGRGDPSPITARSVYDAIRAGAESRLGRDDLRGLRIGVLGVGKVGAALAAMLAEAGAALVLADTDGGRAAAVAGALGARTARTAELLSAPLDVLAPCATGEAIDVGLARELPCAVIAGAANNPLTDDRAAAVLHERDVLYVPDFLANCGGMVSVAAEYRGAGEAFVDDRLAAAATRLRALLAEARAQDRMPVEVAREHAWLAINGARRDGRTRQEG